MATTLVGRGREMAEITGLFAAARSEGAQVMILEGEPGIGKSALVAAAAEVASGAGLRVLAARADELAGRRSFGLVTDCLGGLGLPAPARQVGLALTSPLGGTAPGGADAEFAASEAAIAAVDSHCASGPVVLILEDLHWADRSSLYVLRRLVRHTATLPLVLLGTMRPVPRPAELAALLADVGPRGRRSLGALESPAVDELVMAVVGGAPGPHLRVQAAMAGGNPLYVLEVLDALRAERALSTSRGVVDVAGVARPPSLRLTVLHRLSFLKADTLQVLSLAAVLGARFRPGHLSMLANRPMGDLLGPIRDALAAGLVIEDGVDMAFRHELVRDALYEDLPLGVRAGLHRHAAQVLAPAGAPAGIVAEHLLRGAEPGDREIVGQLQAVARQLADSAPVVAADLLQRALDLAGPRNPARPGLLADLAMALLWAGRAEEGEAACRRAIAGLRDSTERAALRQCLADSLLHRGQAAALLAEVDTGLLEPGLDPLARARLEGLAANARLFLGDLRGAAAQADAVEAAGRALGSLAVQIRALVVRALLSEYAGRSAQAAELAGRAVALAGADGSREVHESQPHLTQGMFLIDADRFGEAVSLFGRGLEAQEALGARSMLPIHHVCLGFAHFWSGRWDQAAAEIETGIALAEETGTGWRVAARGLRAVVALARDDMETAERWLDAAESELAAGEAPYRVQWLRWARVQWMEAHGDPAGAMELVEGMASQAPTMVLATVGPTLARLAVAGGRRDLARLVGSGLETLAKLNPGFAGIAAAAGTVAGLLAGDAAALQAAAAGYGLAGRPLEAGLAAEAGAELTAASRARTVELLELALAAYRSLEAPALAARVSRRLAGLGAMGQASATQRRRPTHGWGALTPTELRVLRLVAERKTNPEIAGHLVMSRRTVETHLTHILAKIGLRSRLELSEAAAGRFGWRFRLDEPVQDREQG